MAAMERKLLLLLLGLVHWGVVEGELTLDFFSNSALHGSPESNVRIESLQNVSFTLAKPYSAEITGTLTVDQPDAMYAFACDMVGPSDDSVFAFVWVSDHLICHTNPPFGNTPSSTDGSLENPLRDLGKKGPLTVVVHVYVNRAAKDANATWNLSMQWQHLTAPATEAAHNSEPIPASAFSPTLPAPEIQRRALQNSEKQGWNLWSYNLLSAVKLPASSAFTTFLCQLSSQQCLTATHIQTSGDVSVRVGLFAADRSYWQYYVGYKGINVSLAYTGGTSAPLRILAEPQNCASVNCSDFALVTSASFKWGRVGTASVHSANGSIAFRPLGLPEFDVVATSPGDESLPLPASVKADPFLAFGLGKGALAFAEGASTPTLAEVQKAVGAALQQEVTHTAKWGDLAEVKTAVQSATMWNYIYVPTEYGPFLPVSRSWNFVKHEVNQDWAYVIFDWDNFFASYLAASDSRAKNISISNLIQVVRSRTAKGFVPNYSAGGSKSIDRTEPPIGAYIVREIRNKFGAELDWLVELLFDDLLGWNDWFLRERTLGPLGLVSLGSDSYSKYGDYSPGTQQGARFESGLDNSPMYDGDFFNKTVLKDGSSSVGLMTLYDVGMASMFASEARALADLARIINRSDDASMLEARADQQAQLISAHLWDSDDGIFTNKFWNGSFYPRRSPTSFYAMLAQAASKEQASTMMSEWLLSPKHFCIAPDGDFKGNSDTCYWGLPSIEASDPAFPPLGYWRGYVWGPMAQLTYWSLQQSTYADVPIVQTARKALCKQMTALMLSQWHANRHICENFNPHRTADTSHGDCSGSKFYHWGALTGLISIIESGLYFHEPT